MTETISFKPFRGILSNRGVVYYEGVLMARGSVLCSGLFYKN